MTNPRWKHRWTPLVAAGLLGLALTAGSSNVLAADDEEYVAPDVRFFRGILHGLGLRQDGEGIDYRERSPLVVPPGRNLPPPETSSVAEKSAAWPNDPDVKRAKELRAQRKQRTKTVDDENRPELPDQLGPRAKTTPPGQVPTPGPYTDPTAPSTWAELGSKSFFSMGGLLGNKEEYATFTNEPPRTSLTEPPPGYRTPSPTQPYGVGKQRGGPGKADVMDHAASNAR